MKNSDMPASPVSMEVVATQNHQDYMDDDFINNFRPMIGLTKRETFSIFAMQGLLMRRVWDDKDVAREAVRFADALLLELEIKNK